MGKENYPLTGNQIPKYLADTKALAKLTKYRTSFSGVSSEEVKCTEPRENDISSRNHGYSLERVDEVLSLLDNLNNHIQTLDLSGQRCSELLNLVQKVKQVYSRRDDQVKLNEKQLKRNCQNLKRQVETEKEIRDETEAKLFTLKTKQKAVNDQRQHEQDRVISEVRHSMRDRFSTMLKNKLSQQRNSLLKQFDRHIVRVSAELATKHKQELEIVHSKHELETANLKVELDGHQRKADQQKQRYQDDLERIHTAHREEISTVQQELEGTSSQIQETKTRHLEEVEHLHSMYSDRITALQNDLRINRLRVEENYQKSHVGVQVELKTRVKELEMENKEMTLNRSALIRRIQKDTITIAHLRAKLLSLSCEFEKGERMQKFHEQEQQLEALDSKIKSVIQRKNVLIAELSLKV